MKEKDREDWKKTGVGKPSGRAEETETFLQEGKFLKAVNW